MTGHGNRPPVARQPVSLALRLLDLQLLGAEQEMLGNVDDVALEERDGRLLVVGLLRGPGAWSHRQPGSLGRWGAAVWRRLDEREEPTPEVLPLDHVLRIDSAVHVDGWAERFLLGTAGLELWLRRHVVGKIPGARGGDHPFGGVPSSPLRAEDGLTLTASHHLLSELLGADVVHDDGSSAGKVVEVRARPVLAMDSRVGELVVTSVVHGPYRVGGTLGYRDDPGMGPWPLRVLLRRLHDHDDETSWEDVRTLDWSARRVRLRTS